MLTFYVLWREIERLLLLLLLLLPDVELVGCAVRSQLIGRRDERGLLLRISSRDPRSLLTLLLLLPTVEQMRLLLLLLLLPTVEQMRLLLL